MPMQDGTGPHRGGRGREKGQGRGRGPCGGGRGRMGRGAGRQEGGAAGEARLRRCRPDAPPLTSPLSRKIAHLRSRLARLETGTGPQSWD